MVIVCQNSSVLREFCEANLSKSQGKLLEFAADDDFGDDTVEAVVKYLYDGKLAEQMNMFYDFAVLEYAGRLGIAPLVKECLLLISRSGERYMEAGYDEKVIQAGLINA